MTIPDTAGLSRDHPRVGYREDPTGRDPWGTAVTKSWAQSFADPEDLHVPDPTELDGPDYWFEADLREVDFDVHFRLGATEEGALVVTGLLLGDPGGTQPITTSNLHRLPIGALYDAISQLDNVTSSLAEKARRFKGEIPTRGGQRTSEDEIRLAAEAYRDCIVTRPNDTIKCVAERIGASSATASRRVSRARDMGLLTDPRKELLAELHLKNPNDFLKEYPVLSVDEDYNRAFRRYKRVHRRAWVSLDQLKRAEAEDLHSSTTKTKQTVELRSKRYKNDHKEAENARVELSQFINEKIDNTEPPF